MLPIRYNGGMDSLTKLLAFLDRLDASHIYFPLARHRNEAIMVRIDVPGERWEVEFFADGHVEAEAFGSSKGVEGEEALDRLFRDFAD